MRNDALERKQTRILPLGFEDGFEYKVLVTPLDGRTNLVQLAAGGDHGRWAIVDSAIVGAKGTEMVLDSADLKWAVQERRRMAAGGGIFTSTALFIHAADADECEQCGRYLRDCRCG